MQKTWLKIIPWVHTIFSLIDFVVIPIIVIVQTLSNRESMKTSHFTGPLMLFAFTSVVFLFMWVPLQIVPVYIAAVFKVMIEKKRQNLKKGCNTWSDLYEAQKDVIDQEIDKEIDYLK